MKYLFFLIVLSISMAQEEQSIIDDEAKSLLRKQFRLSDIKPVTKDDTRFRSRRFREKELQKVIVDYGKLIVDSCPPMLCTGLDCALATEQNGCQICACPIGSPARGCDPMPFVLWHELMNKGCPVNGTNLHARKDSQKVTRWFRRINRFTSTDECESYVFPYCSEIDHNLWRSPRTKNECIDYCYSIEEQRNILERKQQ